ncbi:MAG: GNAT family N-acetyltransferase [Pseudomonadota bacterium]
MDDTVIRDIDGEELDARLDAFGQLLFDAVHAGASINFVAPFTLEEASDFWREKTLPGLLAGKRVMLIAETEGRLAGTVQIDIDTPPNQPHRAEVTKLIVHPDMRRRGIARALMVALEDRALKHQRSLLTLDTRTGDAAEPLYTSLGYVTVGMIPGYCVDPLVDRLDPTTIMYKTL